MEVPAGVHKLGERFSKLFDMKGFEAGVDFQPRPTDVIIVCAPKSGTTWLQQICHGLRSNGDMSFDEIGMVVPGLQMALSYGYGDIQKEQPYEPRMFKCHLWYPAVPKGAGKYIYIVRNPADAAVSFYHFKKDWMFDEGDMSLDEFVEYFFLSLGEPKARLDFASHHHSIASWYPHRKDNNVLWLHYDDLKENLAKYVRLISDFLQIGVGNEELLEKVTKQASFDFMKQNITKFDEHNIKLMRNEAMGLDKRAGFGKNVGKVRNGVVNEANEVLSERSLSLLEKRWKEVVTPATGYDSYAEFRAGINKELGRDLSA